MFFLLLMNDRPPTFISKGEMRGEVQRMFSKECSQMRGHGEGMDTIGERLTYRFFVYERIAPDDSTRCCHKKRRLSIS
jgi:hypothetical protein